MTDQERNELRVKVAEILGWHWSASKHGHWIITDPKGKNHEPGFDQFVKFNAETGELNPPMPKWYQCESLFPNYPNDLNACHEFEKTLTQTEWWMYLVNLREQFNFLPRDPRDKYFVHATAEQRCRAFVATMEKGEHHGR